MSLWSGDVQHVVRRHGRCCQRRSHVQVHWRDSWWSAVDTDVHHALLSGPLLLLLLLPWLLSVIMVALWNRTDHYIFMLLFVLLLLLSSFFSSPNLSRRRLDVCHTSTHGVALVQILDAGLKPAARGSLKTQDAKKSRKIAIWALSHNFVGLYLRNEGTYRQSEKNLLSSDMSSTCSHIMVNFGLLGAEIGWPVWGTPTNFNGLRVLAALLHHSKVVSVSQTLQRWTEGATYVRQGDHHVGHWPTFLVH